MSLAIFIKRRSMNSQFADLRKDLNGLQEKQKYADNIIGEIIIKLENVQKLAIVNNELVSKARPLDVEDRLQAIELWKAKLHAMITETTPRGKEKLNRIGKKFMRG